MGPLQKYQAMDLAYDHIQEQALAPENEAEKKEKKPESTLNSDFQEAYKAIFSSPWGARLGGFFGNVVKQGESVYKQGKQRTHRSAVIHNQPNPSAFYCADPGGQRAGG